MRVFLTGATGFIGAAIIPELLGAGHQVLGLTRSDAGAASLRDAGAEVYRGTLEDPESLRGGAAQADGVIHCAFDHDFSNFVANCEKDRRAIEAIGSELAGSNRPFVVTSAVMMGSPGPGQTAVEDFTNLDNPNPRTASERTAIALLDRGVHTSMVRLPQVHDTVKQGLVTYYIAVTREKGVAAYTDKGLNRWSAAHVLDTARLYRLALEKNEAGARYHAVAEEGVPLHAIAETVGKGLGVPVASLSQEEAGSHFGWLAMFAGLDLPASSRLTQERLDWHPNGPGLLTDLANMNYNG